MTNRAPVIVAMTGASGSLYGIRLIKALINASCPVMVILSKAGEVVLAHETGFRRETGLSAFLSSSGIKAAAGTGLEILDTDDIGALPASGSFIHGGMVVAPCSMKTLASIACGFADTLITRAADVCLKERRPLILLPRETPLNLIHLENMTRLCRAGATIMPPVPSFYSGPASVEDLVDTVVARVLDHLAVGHDPGNRWQP